MPRSTPAACSRPSCDRPHGSIRGTRGGPNWSVLVAAVMALVLAWSVARLIMDSPVELRGTAPILNGSAGLANGGHKAAPAVPVVLNAAGGGAHVVVRDGSGKVGVQRRSRVRPDQDAPGLAAGAGPVHGRLPGDDRGRPGARARSARPASRPRTPTRPTDRFRVTVVTARAGGIGGSARRRHTRQTMTTRLLPESDSGSDPVSVALVTLGLRPQRGRLRGARRSAGGRRLPAGRRRGGRRHGRGQHLRVRRGRQEGLRRHAAAGR